MSYRRAWLLVDMMNRCFESRRRRGGRGRRARRRARLTPLGADIVRRYRRITAAAERQVPPISTRSFACCASDLLLRRLVVAEQLVEEDRAERRRADAAEREAADLEREVAGADGQRHRGGDEIAGAREIDVVLHPDASRRSR